MNGKLLTLFVLIGLLLVVALFSLRGEVAWLAAPFLAYLGVAILRAPAAEQIRLEAARVVEPVENDGPARTIRVQVTVRQQGAAALPQVYLADPPLSRMRAIDGALEQWQALAPGAEASLAYTFQTTRGQFTWSTLHAVVSDPLGVVETHLDVPAPASTQVHPELIRFQSLPIHPNRTLHFSGLIPARLGGSGTDFWGIREYQPGDPLRRLDWHHAARHPGRRFTREFEQEEIAEIGLILDARPETDLRVGSDSLFEHAVRAAASLAEVSIRQGNRVSLLVYGDPLFRVYPGYGKGQLNQIMNTLTCANTEPNRGENGQLGSPYGLAGGSLSGLAYLPVRMFSTRSIILIITPLASGDWRLFPRLRAHGYQTVLISPNPVDFASATLARDVPTQLAARLSQVERQLEIQRITRLWIPVIDWKVSQPLPPLVQHALAYSHLEHRF